MRWCDGPTAMVLIKGNWLVCADNCDAFTEPMNMKCRWWVNQLPLPLRHHDVLPINRPLMA
nr:hypothetical protein Q903MT_gene1530 [Picea sitchensis]